MKLSICFYQNDNNKIKQSKINAKQIGCMCKNRFDNSIILKRYRHKFIIPARKKPPYGGFKILVGVEGLKPPTLSV